MWGTAKLCGGFEVGDGSCDFEDAVVGAGGESLLEHGAFEEFFGVGRESQWARIWRVDIWALERIFSFDERKRWRWRSRAARTRARMAAEFSMAAAPRSSL